MVRLVKTVAPLVPLLITVFLFAHIHAGYSIYSAFNYPEIFGDKSVAIFDLWSIQHFLAGILIGQMITRTTKDPLLVVSIAMNLAYFWELHEFFGELGLSMFYYYLPAYPELTAWFGGVEHWSNRLLGDPILVSEGVSQSLQNTHHHIFFYK